MTTTSTRVYLDYNATAPMRPEVVRAMQSAMANAWGNPSSAAVEGRAAKALIEEARQRVATAIGAQPPEIVFTGGGTESDNIAIQGCLKARHGVRYPHLVTTQIEHHAILQPCRALETQGIRISLAACDAECRIVSEDIAKSLDDETVLVSIMHVNNETGTVQPVRAIAERAHAAGALVHTDAVQSLGKLPVDVNALGVDLLSLSGHKFGGPKGVGVLYVRAGTPLTALMQGGPQEYHLRPGTENVHGIVGLGVAIQSATARLAVESARQAALKARLWAGIRATIDLVAWNGANADSVCNTLNVSFEGTEGEAAVMALDMEGIAVSTGAACAVGAVEPSHVLEAMCCGRDRCRSALRFSLGYATTTDEIDAVLRILPRVIARLRKA